MNYRRKIHNEACKTDAAQIIMDRNKFAEIATNTQQAWEQLAEAKRGYEEGLILKSLKHIQASIVGLEHNYEDIQVKVTENNEEMARKLNEIQATTIRVENKQLMK